jgi:hypothetical protein
MPRSTSPFLPPSTAHRQGPRISHGRSSPRRNETRLSAATDGAHRTPLTWRRPLRNILRTVKFIDELKRTQAG